MSALDDTITRIKGAIAGMQEAATATAKPPPSNTAIISTNSVTVDTSSNAAATTPSNAVVVFSPQEKQMVQLTSKETGPSKWLPPALRPKQPPSQSTPTDLLEVITSSEPPRSPKPAWNSASVHLPKESTTSEPISKKQQNALKGNSSQFRWDILSFNPPVKGMRRQELSVNDVLFEKPGKSAPRVSLPSPPQPQAQSAQTTTTVQPGPKINLPVPGTQKTSTAGAFGRPKEADGASTWRKPGQPEAMNETARAGMELNTTSRSPPPAAPSAEGKTVVSSTAATEKETVATSFDLSSSPVVQITVARVSDTREVVTPSVGPIKGVPSPHSKPHALPSPALTPAELSQLPNAAASGKLVKFITFHRQAMLLMSDFHL
jgi:serine/arginine repetitive matrix protein 2